MVRTTCLSIFVSILLVSGAHAQTRNWTGFHMGVHGGGATSNNSASLDDGSQFCWVGGSTTGDGATSSSCSVSPTQVSASTEATTAGAASASAAAAGSNAPNVEAAAASASAVGTGGVSAVATAEVDPIFTNASAGLNGSGSAAAGSGGSSGPDTAGFGVSTSASFGTLSARGTSAASANEDPAIFAATATSTASGPQGTARAVAVALFNALDLGNGGSVDNTSISVGAHIGYDHQLPSNIVIGFEADVSFLPKGDTTIHASDSFGLDTRIDASRSVKLETNHIGTARLRLGYAAGHLLPYVTGGIAYADFNVARTTQIDFSDSNGDIFSARTSGKSSQHAWGGVVGGGLAWMWSDKMVFSGEGLYYAFDESVNFGPEIFGFTNQRAKLDDIVEFRGKISVILN